MALGVLVDANVLYSRTLRDWLFLLKLRSEAGMFTVYATEDIIAEVLYRLRRDNPSKPGAFISGIHDRVVANIDDRITDFQIDGSFPGNDPDDAHVHAAAVASGARILLTDDSGFTDLPDDAIEQLPYEVHTCDSFFVLVDDVAPAIVSDVAAEQHAYWTSKPDSTDIASALERAGCPIFADRVREHMSAFGPPE